MADRINATQPVVPQTTIQGVPTLSFSTGTADSLRRMAEVTRAVTVGVNQRLDTQAAIDATRAGQIDGGKGILNETLLYAPTIYGQAYTQAATQAYTSKLDMDARFQANRIYAENPNDPEAVAKAMNAYRVGAVAAMPEEMRPGYNLGFGLLQQTMTSKANADFVAVAAAQAEADAIAIQAAVERTISQVAPQVFSTDPAASSAALDYVGYMRAQIDGLYSSTIEDAYGNQVPAFSAVDGAKALLQFDSDVAYYGTLGWFEGQVAAGRSISAMSRFINGEGATFNYTDPDTGEAVTLFAGDALLPADNAKLVGEMRSMASAYRSQVTWEQGQTDRYLEQYNDNALLSFELAATDFGAANDIYRAALSDPRVDASTLSTMRTRLEGFTGGISDPSVVSRLEASIYLGSDPYSGQAYELSDIITMAQAGGLAPEDTLKLTKMFADRQDANHYTNWQEYRQGLVRLRQATGLPDPSASVFMQADDQSVERFNAAALSIGDWVMEQEQAGIPVTRESIKNRIEQETQSVRDTMANRTPLADVANAATAGGADFIAQARFAGWSDADIESALQTDNAVKSAIPETLRNEYLTTLGNR
jgi:hypothetical protein